MLLVLVILATYPLRLSSAEDAELALNLDDQCGNNDDSDNCDVSFRQLRGEARAVDNDEANSSAPQFNYNWNFGCTGSSPQPKPAGDNMQFNLNWNFCFDKKTTNQAAAGGQGGAPDMSSMMKRKPGNCRVFGCTASFDFTTLNNECQCFPGCDKTFLGNTCCPDFQRVCSRNPAGSDHVDVEHYTAYANADCSSKHGAVELATFGGSVARCADRCNQDNQCEGFVHSTNGQCKILSGINIPACHASPGIFSTYVRKFGRKPPVCAKYMAETGCSWTAQWNCPGQAGGSNGHAGDDGTHGYNCCCKLGFWKGTRPALPAGTPLRIVNVYSDRALFAKKDQNWESGCGAGTPKEKVHDDGVWTLIPQHHGHYRIVNQLSNRALYAKVDDNWEQGWGAGSPPSAITDDGLWSLVPDGKGAFRIVNVKSQRALYAKPGGPGEMSWSGGVGAGYPPDAVHKDAAWNLDFV